VELRFAKRSVDLVVNVSDVDIGVGGIRRLALGRAGDATN
jgi:hypothetical protein